MDETLSGATLRERAELVLAVPLAHALGIELLDPGRPELGATLTVGDLAGNGAGGAHAAALGAGLELAGYLALAPQLSTAEHDVTHMSTVTLLAAARAGDRVELRGELDRRTRRLGFVTAAATVGDETIARAVLAKSIVPFSG